LKFGAIIGESGPVSSSFGVSTGVLKAWTTWTNAHGGVNGHPVDMIVMNDQGSPSVGLADAHTLIEGDHVLAITANGISTSGWGPYVEQAGVPVIGPSWDEGFGTTQSHANVYSIGSSQASQFVEQFQAAKYFGGTKAGSIFDPSQSSAVGKMIAFSATALPLGISFYKAIGAAEQSPSFAAPCLALKQASVDVLVTPFADQPYKQIVDSCAAQGWKPIVLGDSAQTNPDWLTDSNFVKAGGSIEGFPWFDTSIPAIATFNQVMQQNDPSALHTVPLIAALVWATMEVFAAGAKAANLGNNATPQQLISGLNTISNNTFGGLTPPLTFSNGGNLKVTNCTYVIYKGTDKSWHVLQNGSSVVFCLPQSDVDRFNVIQGV
jgi:branched-chain amino acid transport system substrate-binding protein